MTTLAVLFLKHIKQQGKLSQILKPAAKQIKKKFKHSLVL